MISRRQTTLSSLPPRDRAAADQSLQSAERKTDRLRALLSQALGRRFTDGNSLELLQNGVQIFPAMLEAIANARHRVDFVTYVYWTGEIAREFAAALSGRARAGVHVRVLLDAFGAKKMDSSLVDEMQAAGVDVRWFRPVATWRFWRSDKRTHRKLLICDDDIAFTGGVGIAEEWQGDARNPDEWRDTHVAIRGPAVTELRAAFLDNWNEAGDWHFESRISAPEIQAQDVGVQVIRASSTIGWTDAAAMLRALVSLSEHRLRIVTAYFNPDQALVELLIAAAERGVDVQILIPGQYCDSRLSQLAGHLHISRLLRSGVRLWRYQQTMLHSKLITVDGHLACIGSANMNHRSIGKDEECCVIATCEDLARQLDERFAKDCECAEPYQLDEWQNRGMWLRAKERCARMVVEQL